MPTQTPQTIDYPWCPAWPGPEWDTKLDRWLAGLAEQVIEYVRSKVAGQASYAGVDVRTTVDSDVNATDLAAEAEVESENGVLLAVRITVHLVDQWVATGGEGGGWERSAVTLLATPADQGTRTTLAVQGG